MTVNWWTHQLQGKVQQANTSATHEIKVKLFVVILFFLYSYRAFLLFNIYLHHFINFINFNNFNNVSKHNI